MASASHFPAPAQTLSSRLYALLLYAYPAAFREAYGRQMSQVFRDLCRDTYRQHRAGGLMWLWFSTLVDVGITALNEWLAPHGGPGNVIYKAGVGLAAGMIGGVVAGLGARLAMRGVSLASGLTPGFTLDGTLVILMLGMVMGMPFGLVFMPLRPLLPGEGFWKGLTYGLLLFVVFIAPPFLFYRDGEALLANPGVTLSLFTPVALAYGVVVQLTAMRLERTAPDRKAPVQTAAPIAVQLAWLVIYACLLELAVLGIISILTHNPRIPMALVRLMQAAHIPFAIGRDLNAWIISLSAIAYYGTATLMFWARNRSPMARFTAISLLLFGGAVFNTGSGYYASLTHDTALVETVFRLLQVAGTTCLLAVLSIFPDGRFALGWSRVVFALWCVWAVAWAAAPIVWPEAALLAILAAFFVSGVIAQVQRYRQLATLAEREVVRPIVFGFAAAVAGFALVAIMLLLIPDLRVAKVTGLSVTATFSLYLLPWVFIPLTIGWAMYKHKLWTT